jgi:putative ABC transport system permease protein
MLKHYLTQALRSFWRFRITAGVSLLGLVLAMACFIASYLYIDSLTHSDTHFPKASRTWVLTQELWSGAERIIPAYSSAGPPAAAYLREDFPGLEAVARAIPLQSQSAATEDRKVDLQTAAIDPEFLKIFDFDFKAGDPATAVTAAHSAIITERTAQRLYGGTEALGRRILLQNKVEVTVTGVIADVPRPSHMEVGKDYGLPFEILIPMQVVKELKTTGGIGVVIDPEDPDWTLSFFRTYVLFPQDGSFTPQQFLQQLPAFTQRRANRPGAPLTSVLGAIPLPYEGLHFIEAVYGSKAVSITTMMFALDALILFVACINYANLAVAIAATRLKEMGVRKVVGATRLHLLRQSLTEAALLACAAIVLVVLLAALAIEPVNRALDTSLTFASLLRPQLWLMVVGLIAFITIIGGIYPAIALARVRPVDALRAGSVKAGPRFVPTVLVGVQFAAASFMLVVAFLMAQQNRLLQQRGLHTGTDPVIVIGNDLTELGISFDTLREELLRNAAIKEVGSMAVRPWLDGGGRFRVARGAERGATQAQTYVDFVGNHFFDVMGMKLLAGRLPDSGRGDRIIPFNLLKPGQDEKVVIDRGLAGALGWSDPNAAIDKVVYAAFGPSQLPFRIIGVVESGHPRILAPSAAADVYGLAPMAAGVTEAVRHIDATWNQLAPKIQVRREFMDTLFESAFQTYSRINSTLNGLSSFAFVIAIMGLCGLAIHVTNRRQREIGIRKTLGATVGGVVTMLLVDFGKPVLIASLLAWPFAWYVGHLYIDRFAQRSEITIWPFALGLLITVGVASAAVVFQTLRAATVKPANVLYAE